MSDDELIRLSSDALISLVVIEAQSREQKRIAQLAQEVPDFTPSPEFTKGISELLKKFHAKQKSNQNPQRDQSHTNRCDCIHLPLFHIDVSLSSS